MDERQREGDEPLARARCSLAGLSVGDAFGECFFVFPATVAELVAARALPDPPWTYTDDTQMALSLVATLAQDGTLDQDRLALRFAAQFDPERSYGPAMEGHSRGSAWASPGSRWRRVCSMARAPLATALPCALRHLVPTMPMTSTPLLCKQYAQQR